MYDVSIITVNYNSSDDTLNMIESVENKTTLSYEIIVVDNNSSIEEYKKLEILKTKENIKLIRSRLNLGFAGGNMLGFKEANSKYLFFLNNDTLLINNVIDILYKDCENDNNIGLISPQLFDENINKTTTFRYFPTVSEKYLGKGFSNFISTKKRYNNKKEYENIIDVEVVSGASMFFNKECFENINGFDTDFFLYCEEEDLSKRVIDYGLKVCFEPNAHLIHLCGKSTGRNFKIEREFIISYFKLLDKHFGFIRRGLLKLHIFLKYLFKANKNETNKKLFNFIFQKNKQKYSLRNEQKMSDE
ncbi:glycosyltransferase family 2 protein [Halarcobacter sp.]|uniref:glycosyltransferase family 2 protein n=1 Tax=Halarcobacter sp. TaxID=2321133 RepID=UPI002AA7BE2A|nr:glycosyltransferase family 2 protein [Halarcobacter sp.]